MEHLSTRVRHGTARILAWVDARRWLESAREPHRDGPFSSRAVDAGARGCLRLVEPASGPALGRARRAPSPAAARGAGAPPRGAGPAAARRTRGARRAARRRGVVRAAAPAPGLDA